MRSEASENTKSLELEQRIARAEIHVKELQQHLDLQAKRTMALQAQFDHLSAKIRGV